LLLSALVLVLVVAVERRGSLHAALVAVVAVVDYQSRGARHWLAAMAMSLARREQAVQPGPILVPMAQTQLSTRLRSVLVARVESGKRQAHQ
jgi:hypothetical protein